VSHYLKNGKPCAFSDGHTGHQHLSIETYQRRLAYARDKYANNPEWREQKMDKNLAYYRGLTGARYRHYVLVHWRWKTRNRVAERNARG
jgi:hypothetical protein